MNFKFKITVFTPTYNRAYMLHNLYESLQRQTFRDFEWLVVDDGSTDCTEALFTEWIKNEKKFTIQYFKQPNGGKCRAINYALDLAQGELFFTVDSDDYLTDDALEKIAAWADTLPQNASYCGVAGNLGTGKDDVKNGLFDGEYYDGDLLDRYKKVDGERAVVIYTDIHRCYKYPEFNGEKFMTEAVAWNRMAHDGYKMRFYNDIIWIYEYQEDGLTKAGNQLFINNPHGYGLWLKEKAEFTGAKWIGKLRLYYTFTCELLNHYDKRTIAECIGTSTLVISLCSAVHNSIRFFRGKR